MCKRSFFIFFVVGAFAGCGEPTREDVISRYSGGEKEVVATYQGTGADEKLVERRTYDPDGTLVLIEDLVSGTERAWAEINDGLLSSRKGLMKSLLGDWYSKTIYIVNAENPDHRIEWEFALSITEETFTTEQRWRMVGSTYTGDEWTSNSKSGAIEFLDDKQIRRIPHIDAEAKEEATPNIVFLESLEFLSPNSFASNLITLVDNRLEIGPVTSKPMYRNKDTASLRAFVADKADDLDDGSRDIWRSVALGDEILRTEYPSYYETVTGFDPTLSREQLEINFEADNGYCVSIGPLMPSEASDIEKQASRINLRNDVRLGTGEIFVGHWVTVRGISSRAAANRILQKLKDVGLKDAYVLTEGGGTQKVSLGLFSELSKAEMIMTQAKSAGVAAEIVPRTREGDVSYIDVAVPADWDTDSLLAGVPEHSMLRGEAATCPGKP